MRKLGTIHSLLFSFFLLAFSHTSFGQIGIAVSFGPPALPVYEQPICPQEGYIWTPGFWDYTDDDGYYWVPGTWVEAPQSGYLWTPGYWGGEDGAFIFHEGYWGEHVGFYGGIDYGYGYGGRGYEGGRWDNGRFFYNTSVNRVNETIIHNTYRTTVIENNTNRISYNGGNGGVSARPTAQDETFSREQHVGRVTAQNEHIQQARSNPELRASNNQGKPPIAATAKPGDFKSGVVPARQAGGAYTAPPGNAARSGNETRAGNAARPATEARPADRPTNNSEARPVSNGHAKELQSHNSTPPNTGNATTDRRYQQQQSQLAAKQNQEHQKLQQQQEKEHQQATKKNFNDAQKQQMEERHTQQTQKVEQKHATQQQQMQQRQQPRPSASKPTENRPSAEKPH
jgi:WXXGXW repeat (2 copies)